MTFDVTIPVLNEEATLEQNIRVLHAFLKEHFPHAGQWRIVIADNGSTDRTPEIARSLSAEVAEVTFLKVPKKGVGMALKASWSQSQADIVGYMDLDLATSLTHFLEAYRAIAEEGYELVYATRLHPRSEVIGRPFKRELASRVFNALLKLYLGVHFSDGMCGFKFLRRDVYPRLYETGAQNDGWFFSTELLVTAEWLGVKTYELPVRWKDDASSSKVKVLPLARRYLAAMRSLKKRGLLFKPPPINRNSVIFRLPESMLEANKLRSMESDHPILILGTAMWGWTVPEATCFALLDTFYGAGYREIDGATNYPINKNPDDFRRAEGILQKWIRAHGVQDLKVMMKVGSIDNMRTPDNNLSKSFLLLVLDEYRELLGANLDTFMIHWDNREEEPAIRQSLEALGEARRLGLRIGLSGIRHPKVYARLNESYRFDFRIQAKHNLLQSDYPRYKPFHGQRRFIAYGINAGGIKLDPSRYQADSSLKARGGDTSQAHPITRPLGAILQRAQQVAGRPAVENFNHCGMAFAYHSPDIAGILLGTSRESQLKDSMQFYQKLINYDYSDLYKELKDLHEQQS